MVLDDGGHCNDQLCISFEEMWPHVVSGGLYCIEDLGVDEPSSVFIKEGYPRHSEWIGDKVKRLISKNGCDDIESMTLSRELAILRKK